MIVLCASYRTGNEKTISDFLEVGRSVNAKSLKQAAIVTFNQFGLFNKTLFPRDDVSIRNLDEENHALKIALDVDADLSGKQRVLDQIRDKPNENYTEDADVKEGGKTADIFENILILSPLLDSNFSNQYKTLIVTYSESEVYLAYLLDAMLLALVGVAQATFRNATRNFRHPK